MNMDFYMPVRTISGRGCVRKNGGIFSALGTKCLIMTSGSSAKKSGALADVLTLLDTLGIQYNIFDEITENPYLQACLAAGQAAAECGAQFIVGIGGGSPLDASKAAAVFAANPKISAQQIYNMDWKNKPIPVILIGTTAGTGSEVTAVSVMTDRESGRKRALTHPDCFARIAFLDPQYTDTMPYPVTVSTALDALAHAVEGFLSPGCGAMADLCARHAIPMIWQNITLLEQASASITKEMRDELYYGSIWAGLVLCCTGTAFPHPFGYILTEDFAIPHGRACAAFLPALLDYTMENNPERATQLLELTDCPYTNFKDIVSKLSQCSEIKMAQEQILCYAERWKGLKNFENVSGGYSVEKGIALFETLFCIK